MRLIYILLLTVLLVGCTKRTPPLVTTAITLSALQVETIIYTNGIVPWNGIAIADIAYELPSEEWFATEWPTILYNFQKDLKQTQWISESNDCDDYTKMAAAFARLLHSNTPNKTKNTGLAVGEFYYCINGDKTQGHAINFALVRTKEGLVKVVFFDPQLQTVVRLSKTELESCSNWLL